MIDLHINELGKHDGMKNEATKTEASNDNKERKIPVFAIHYTKLKHRRACLDKQLKYQNMEDCVEFITGYDKETLTKKDLKKYSTEECFRGRKLLVSELSLMCKHFHAMNIIVERDLDYALIIEDDVLLCDNFMRHLNTYVDQVCELDPEWDCLFVGSGFNLHVPVSEIVKKNGTTTPNVFLKGNNGTGRPEHLATGWPICGGSSRCADSYVISKKAAKFIYDIVLKLNESGKKITLPYDIWLNYIFKTHNMKIYWAEPTIAKPDNFISSVNGYKR